MANRRQIKLGMFLRPAGHHIAAWRHPDAQADAGWDFSRFTGLAQIAERGLFDMLFLADTSAVPSDDMENIRHLAYVAWIEPFTTMAALASVTRHIGLVCTSSTSFETPFGIARKFASLDLVSGGRAGWNLITSANPLEWRNFGAEPQGSSGVRYARAREFAGVVQGLWDSWDDDAFIVDKPSGIFFDPAKLHVLDHKGEHFQVRGPLNVRRSPQGQPVLVQAGASEDGRSLAAETADVIFAANTTLDIGREFYADVKARVARCGRNPDHVLIMPGFQVMLGESEQQARDRFEFLQNLIPDSLGVRHLSTYIGVELSGYPVDGPLPDLPLTNVNVSRTKMLFELARRENLTIRQLYQRIAGGRGHFQTFGTPKQVADTMEEWVTTGAADGFNYMAPLFPTQLEEFVATVIPELQRRGLYRTRYEADTLRGNLGLPRRESRHVRPRQAARA
ncbi:MAG: LLM class flavin-dependent oxidoreductase [Xanthobacteraceae bacterium]|nr:LLM class flavin-dependent oxidoreductase [Xanthobacteraceae bacterium]